MSALDDILEEHTGKIQAQIDAERAEFVAASEAEKSWERTTFVREAAALLFIYGRPDDATGQRRPLQPRDCWTFAVALWDAKPEDC